MAKRKRKHSDYSDNHILRKIRRLEDKIRRRQRSPPPPLDYSSDEERPPASEPGSPAYRSDEDLADSDYSDYEPSVRSVVVADVHVRNERPAPAPASVEPRAPSRAGVPPPPRPAAPRITPPRSAAPCPDLDEIQVAAEPTPPPADDTAPVIIAQDILDALGESKRKEIPLGVKVPDEISKRWGRILTDGLSREHKQELVAKMLIPENFQLLKAPVLNQEIAAVLTESSRNRDKRLEKAQNQLGIGLAGITSLMSSLIEGKEVETVEIVKKLSETGQILLDLHYENTVNRTKLITPILDKKFLSLIQDVKRDSHLFGDNLGGTIKATKTAEKSGLQIKKYGYAPASSSKKSTAQTGSWRGPPRQQGQRAARPTASRSRGAAPAPRRAQHAAERPHPAPPTTRPPPARYTRK
ncbi:hypothetical protein NE865_13992 [Phthorimaea operculella]|nr:hypothetical protein NE865_13992 [Phthorimaea operculella]